MNRSLRNEFAIVLGSAFVSAIVGILATIMTGTIPRDKFPTVLVLVCTVLILFALALLSYGFGTWQRARRRIIRGVRNHGLLKPRVGILAGLKATCGEGIDPRGTDIAPQEWRDAIRNAALRRGLRLEASLIPANKVSDRFDAIINPFGSTYPEENSRQFPVYQLLLDYIHEGGLFVNVADIPTYYYFNPKLKRSIDRAPATYKDAGQLVPHFDRVPMMEELAVRVRRLQKEEAVTIPVTAQPSYASCSPFPGTMIATRFAIVEGTVDSVVEPARANEDNLTPLFFCDYGEGRVLCSLSYLTRQYSSNRSLLPLIADLTVHALATRRAGFRSKGTHGRQQFSWRDIALRHVALFMNLVRKSRDYLTRRT